MKIFNTRISRREFSLGIAKAAMLLTAKETTPFLGHEVLAKANLISPDLKASSISADLIESIDDATKSRILDVMCDRTDHSLNPSPHCGIALQAATKLVFKIWDENKDDFIRDFITSSSKELQNIDADELYWLVHGNDATSSLLGRQYLHAFQSLLGAEIKHALKLQVTLCKLPKEVIATTETGGFEINVNETLKNIGKTNVLKDEEIDSLKEDLKMLSEMQKEDEPLEFYSGDPKHWDTNTRQIFYRQVISSTQQEIRNLELERFGIYKSLRFFTKIAA